MVLTDLADFTHLVTRLKYIPEAAHDASLTEIERVQGAEFAGTIAVTTLSRIWQMLLKGIPETENATRPVGAAEMVLIRLAHAGSLPSPEDAARRLATLMNGDDGAAPNGPRPGNGGGGQQNQGAAESRGYDMASSRPQGGPSAMLRSVPNTAPQPMVMPKIEQKPEPSVQIRTLADVANLAGEKRDMKLKAQIRQFVRPVRVEPGKLEITLSPDAPKSLVGDMSTRLKEWTGINWLVILSRDPGGLTLIETDAKERDDRVADARTDPDVAAILSRFPGAKIIDVRISATEVDTDETDEKIVDLEIDEDTEQD